LEEDRIDWDVFIKENCKCCACEGSLASSSMINMGQLDRLATWEHPTAGNVLSSDKRPRAIAIDRSLWSVMVASASSRRWVR